MFSPGGVAMAGVQWTGGKLTATAFRGDLLHNSKDTRPRHSHTNDDIDPTRTCLNWSVLGRTYDEKMAFFNRRMGEVALTKQARGKQERVVAQSLIVYCPTEVEAMGMDSVRDFFQGACDVLSKLVGVENVVDMDVHVDEKHNYVDPDTKETVESRIHGHFVFIPVVDEKVKTIREPVTDENGEPVRDKRGRIKRRTVGKEVVKLDVPEVQANQVATRANMRRANEAMDAMCTKLFGCSYTTGKGKKRRNKTVEELKVMSAEAAAELADQKQRELEEVTRRVQEQRRELERLQRQVDTLGDRLDEIADRERDLDDREHVLAQDEQTVSDLMDVRDTYRQARHDFERASAAYNVARMGLTVGGVDPYDFSHALLDEMVASADSDKQRFVFGKVKDYLFKPLRDGVERVFEILDRVLDRVAPRPEIEQTEAMADARDMDSRQPPEWTPRPTMRDAESQSKRF